MYVLELGLLGVYLETFCRVYVLIPGVKKVGFGDIFVRFGTQFLRIYFKRFCRIYVLLLGVKNGGF